MQGVHILTPVKDSIELTLETIRAITASVMTTEHIYTVYNDFSTEENTARLTEASHEMGFELVNMADITQHPSPNYLLILQTAQQRALADNAAILIVESDVTVKPDTLQGLIDGANQRPDCGLAAAVTVDESGIINYPYLFAKELEGIVTAVSKHCSFCCTLLTNALLKAVDFKSLDPSKNWHDVTISHRSIQAGLTNYLFANLPVLHRPHGSRPWKQLKYKNPLKYYWLKYTKGLDKI